MEIKEHFEKVSKSKTFSRILKEFDLKNRKVLDIGCGNGEFLEHFGNESLGVTSTQPEVDFGRENNLNIVLGNAELIDEIGIEDNFDVIWANNLIEHLLSPHAFLIRLKKISESDTTLILGVPVIPKIYSLLKLNKFRGSLASNHINFFTKKSLELTVERTGWEIKNTRSFVFDWKFLDKIFTSIFSPHVYIIAKNDENFRYPEKKLKEWGGEEYYKKFIYEYTNSANDTNGNEYTNKTDVDNKVIFPELSYKITGILFNVHNELGRYAREKQYGDLLEKKLKEENISYGREVSISNSGNILDFIIEEKIVIELKSNSNIVRDNYRQIQNYLQATNLKLGLLVNFRNEYLKPIRVIRIGS